MKKTAYHKSFKRKFRNGGIIYGGSKYILKHRFNTVDIEGVEVTIMKLGDEPGCFWIDRLYYLPTYTESKFIGSEDGGHLIMIPEDSATAFQKMQANKTGKWVNPIVTDSDKILFEYLFYSGFCERRLNPDNPWLYQYRVLK